jgi:hypothetical protein
MENPNLKWVMTGVPHGTSLFHGRIAPTIRLSSKREGCFGLFLALPLDNKAMRFIILQSRIHGIHGLFNHVQPSTSPNIP